MKIKLITLLAISILFISSYLLLIQASEQKINTNEKVLVNKLAVNENLSLHKQPYTDEDEEDDRIDTDNKQQEQDVDSSSSMTQKQQQQQQQKQEEQVALLLSQRHNKNSTNSSILAKAVAKSIHNALNWIKYHREAKNINVMFALRTVSTALPDSKAIHILNHLFKQVIRHQQYHKDYKHRHQHRRHEYGYIDFEYDFSHIKQLQDIFHHELILPQEHLVPVEMVKEIHNKSSQSNEQHQQQQQQQEEEEQQQQQQQLQELQSQMYDTCFGHALYCQVTQKCWQVMTAFGETESELHTNQLSNRLLFLYVLQSQGCELSTSTMPIHNNTLIEHTLAALWHEHIYDENYSSAFTQRVAIGGVYGYTQFLRPRWIRTIVENQSADGCWREKRDEEVEFNEDLQDCDQHQLALSIVPLSLYLHYTNQAYLVQ